MIQVLKRSSVILDLFRDRSEISLSDVVDALGIRLTTACNIVRAMVELDWLRKENGGYRLGRGIYSMALPELRKRTLMAVAEEEAFRLSGMVREGVVISGLFQGEKINFIKTVYDQDIMVNAKMYADGSFYGTATGRVLLAYAHEATRQAVFERYPVPNGPSGLDGRAVLDSELARVRRRGLAIKNGTDSHVAALAAPVFGSDHQLWAAVGVFLPSVRFRGDHRRGVIKCTREAGKRMSALIAR